MSSAGGLLFEQLLNGIQLGLLLFLLTAGLTLVVGVMSVINLAHGSFYMLGAFLAAAFVPAVGNFYLGIALAVFAVLCIGLAVEFLVIRHLYDKSHLTQVIGTFGLVMIANEAVRLIWGAQGKSLPLPAHLVQAVYVFPGLGYPLFKLVCIALSLMVALFLGYLITRTRVGMQIRAGADDRETVMALGVNITVVYMMIFALSALLAGFAGAMAAPITSASIGMGEEIIILGFVVIVIGGVGSVLGAFYASIIVGIVDTMGRAYATSFLSIFMAPEYASTIGPLLSSMSIYLVMVAVLLLRPRGLLGSTD